jgi:hypothetical protein
LENIIEILNEFEKISLADLNSDALMDRTDTKFATSIDKLPLLLKKLSSYYKILSIDNDFRVLYETLYYDTQGFDMYLNHHNGVLNRFKVRERTYLNANKCFLEVKFKSNKGRTIKERIKRTEPISDFLETEKIFIEEKIPYLANSLQPSVLVNYSRITLVDKDLNEKITIDSDLLFSNKEAKYKLNNLVIVEVKQYSRSKTLVMSALKGLKIKPVSFSKYCLGVNYLYPKVKRNNFKEKLVTLNKIINGTSFDHITSI